jgi:hypothetical protein
MEVGFLTPFFLQTDHQLRFITVCCTPLPIDKRSVFLERLAAHLKMETRLRHPSDRDLEDATTVALRGLMHGSAA